MEAKKASRRTKHGPKRDDYAAGLARLDALARVDWIPPAALLLTQRQVAVLLNVSERTIRNLIRRRKLPVKYIGGRCLIPRAAVEKFARQTAGK